VAIEIGFIRFADGNGANRKGWFSYVVLSIKLKSLLLTRTAYDTGIKLLLIKNPYYHALEMADGLDKQGNIVVSGHGRDV